MTKYRDEGINLNSSNPHPCSVAMAWFTGSTPNPCWVALACRQTRGTLLSLVSHFLSPVLLKPEIEESSAPRAEPGFTVCGASEAGRPARMGGAETRGNVMITDHWQSSCWELHCSYHDAYSCWWSIAILNHTKIDNINYRDFHQPNFPKFCIFQQRVYTI